MKRFSTAVCSAAAVLVLGAPATAAAPAQHAPGATTRNASDVTVVRARAQASFPTARDTGVPRGWAPRREIQGDHVVRRAGAVVQDLRIYGNLVIAAPDVTVKRVDVVGGRIDNWAGSTCQSRLDVRRTTIRNAPGQRTSGDEPALNAGGYRAHRVRIDGLPEGFRVGGKDECGPVRIIRSYATVVAPEECGDWHGDALQGYGGGALKVRMSRLELVEGEDCAGTAAFFYPSGQGNTAVDIDGLLVEGGGYPFRLGTPGRVHNLKVVRQGDYYGPIDVKCSALTAWEAHVVRLDGAGQPVHLRRQRCNTERGS
ncbi:hypothetical protein [Nocardioides hwasunensis]|uniref:Uncharacterized protein n=1 Tax=Nocardioides hwasunensis TaxID=397258 RepID=A0ABR8MGM1_9ACTN|nr:hypothetical protein [Nocardioides hwasunensis]MBD3915222.1 hypothetical protein [Nocardioides hwasunensis]